MPRVKIQSQKDQNIVLDAEVSVKLASSYVFILLHPYGPLGGSMHDHVVDSLFSHFIRNHSAIRFNLRGVAKSSGTTSWTAKGEVEDCLEVIEYSKSLFEEPRKYVLVGYSFGSVVMGATIDKATVDIVGYVAVSYPISVVWFLTFFNKSYFVEPLQQTSKNIIQKLFLTGSEDTFTIFSTYKKFLETIPFHSSVIVEGVDHFWGDKVNELLYQVDLWLASLPSSDCCNK